MLPRHKPRKMLPRHSQTKCYLDKLLHMLSRLIDTNPARCYLGIHKHPIGPEAALVFLFLYISANVCFVSAKLSFQSLKHVSARTSFWMCFFKTSVSQQRSKKTCTKTSVIDPLRLRVQQRVRNFMKFCTVGSDHPLVRCKADTALLPKQLQSFPCLRMNNSLQYIIKFEGWKIPWVGRGSSDPVYCLDLSHLPKGFLMRQVPPPVMMGRTASASSVMQCLFKPF